MALTEERKGEIALAFVKADLKKSGLKSFKANDILREVGNKRQEVELMKLRISPEEVKEFVLEIYQELTGQFLEDLKQGGQ